MKILEHKIKCHNLIFLCIITTIIITSMSFSKYETTIATDSIARVAIMANTVSVDTELPLGAYPGSDPIVCPIIVTNKEGDNICEVSQTFTMEIKRANTENIPLVFELYKDKFCTEIMESDSNGIYSSDEFKFEAGKEEEKIYYLKIRWPEDKNDESYAFEIEYFSINIIATQID